MTEHDWKLATFSLTVEDVAEALNTSSASVVDLMMAGTLGFYVKPSPVKRRTLPLADVRFDPADVQAYRTAKPAVDVAAAEAVLGNLRAYLDAHWPPVASPDAALRTGYPLQARGRAYVRTEVLTEFAKEAGAPIAAQLPRKTEEILIGIGAVRQRGVRPEDDPSKQSWKVWLRLPDAVWNGSNAPTLDEFLQPRGALAADESIVTGSDGPMVDKALPLDGEVWDD